MFLVVAVIALVVMVVAACQKTRAIQVSTKSKLLSQLSRITPPFTHDAEIQGNQHSQANP